jgi:hypothetical protein
MRYVLVMIVLAAAVAGCGKRPSNVEGPEGSTFPRAYPAVMNEPE